MPDPSANVCYRITDWNGKYESAQSRKYPRLNWVHVGNKFDEIGFRYLVAEKDAADLFAAFIAMVMVASRVAREDTSGRPRRDGSLVTEEGRPLTARDLAVQTGFKAEIFVRAFAALTEPTIGWLEKYEVTNAVEDPATAVGESPISPERNRKPTGKSRQPRGSARSESAPPPPGSQAEPTRDKPTPAIRSQAGKSPTLSDPTRKRRTRRTAKNSGPDDPPGGGGNADLRSPGPESGSERGKRVPDATFKNVFVVRVLSAFDLHGNDEKMALLSMVERFVDTPDRQVLADALVALADEKAAGNAKVPIAAWTAEVYKRHPALKPKRRR